MGFFNKLRNTLLRGEDARSRSEEEARFHLEMRQADLEERGLSPQEARAQARRAYGNVTAFQESTGDMDVFLALEALRRDSKIAWRRLRRSPLFLATSIFLLAFGIGTNAAVFSVVDHLFVRPLPFPEPEKLMVLQESRKGEKSNSNPARLSDWAARVPAFAAVMGVYGETLPLITGDGKRGIEAIRTVGDYLGVLGVQPVTGRAFTREEWLGGQVAYLTQRGQHLGRVGDSLNIAGSLYLIVAVVPDLVTLGEGAELITPAPRAIQEASRAAAFLPLTVRLQPDASLASASAQVDAVAQQLAKDHAATDAELSALLRPAQSAWNEDAKDSAWLLQASCLLLLLITVLNLGALFAARTSARQKESAIRGLLGASRWAILRLHFSEAIILSALGATASLLVANWSLALIQALYAAKFPAIGLATLDARVYIFLIAVAIVSALAFTFVMALQSAQSTRPQASAKPWLRSALITAEATLGVLLVAFAFNLAQDFADRESRPLGFATQEIVSATVDLPWSSEDDELVTALDRGHELFATLPGVTTVGVIDRLPLNGGTQSGKVLIQGRAQQLDQEVGFRMASQGFFTALRIPLLAGSGLGEKDAVLVNDSFARRFLDGNAIGRYVARAGKNPKYWRVAGVVSNIRADATEAEARPELYLPHRQFTWPKLEFVLASNQPAAALAPSLRKLTSQLSPNALLQTVAPLEDRLNKLDVTPRRQRDIVALFGLLALSLLVAGVYGVISTELHRRTREVGIRLAVGAKPTEVASLFLRHCAGIAIATLLLSLPLALTHFRAPIAIEAALTVALAILAAALIPAWRSSRIQPSAALRTE